MELIFSVKSSRIKPPLKALWKKCTDFFVEICQSLCCEHIYSPFATYDNCKNGLKYEQIKLLFLIYA